MKEIKQDEIPFGKKEQGEKKPFKKQDEKPTIMPFGKYKGLELGDIEITYLEWLVKEDNVDSKLKAAIEAELKNEKITPPKQPVQSFNPNTKTTTNPSMSETVKTAVIIHQTSLPDHITDENGMSLALRKQTFQLKEQDKHIYKLKNDYSITAAGYYHINKFSNINLLTPPSVIVDGVMQGNPYIIRDRNNQQILMVIVRKIAFGRSPMGNFVAVDQTLSYAPKSYFIRNLYKLVDDNPNMAVIRIKESLTGEELKNGYFVETVDGLGVYISNIMHKDFRLVLKNYSDNQIMGERKATTICERNCLRKHPAIGVSNVRIEGRGDDSHANVTAYSYAESGRSRSKISRLAQMFEQGKIDDIQDVQVVESSDTAEALEEAEVIQTEENEEK